MCLHFSGKCIISRIDFITDVVRQALAKITCFRAAMVYHSKTSIDSIYGFWTLLPTEIQKMVAWLLAKDRFTRPTNIREVSSKFPSSATTLVSVRNTRVFRTALTAPMEPHTLWQRITCYLSPRQRVAFHAYSSTLWWRLRTIRRTRVLHSSQGLQLCSSRLHNAWQC